MVTEVTRTGIVAVTIVAAMSCSVGIVGAGLFLEHLRVYVIEKTG
jgi:hypothetical protein